MNSKFLILLLAGLTLATVSSAEAPSERFAQTALGILPPSQKLALTPAMKDALRPAWGGRYSGRTETYREHAGVRIWVLRARGKHGWVRAGFAVENGRIIKTEVLFSKEQRGKVIQTSRFLRQFSGVGLKQGKKLDRHIDGYSGATISVNAMKKMALAVLILDSFIPVEAVTEPPPSI